MEPLPTTARSLPKGWLPMAVCGCFGTLAIGFGVIEMGFGRLTTLNCRRDDRAQITCQKTERSLTVVEPMETIVGLKSATIEEVGRKYRRAYRVVLRTESGDYPLTEQYQSDRLKKEEAADQINRYVADPTQTTLTLLQDDRGQSNLFGLIFVASGSLFMLMAILIRLAVNKPFNLQISQR